MNTDAAMILRLILLAMVAGRAKAAVGYNVGQERASAGQYRACGANCLFVSSRILGVDVEIGDVDRILPPADDGKNSLAEMAAAATKLGLTPIAASLSWEDLASVPAPAILHVRQLEGQTYGNHFVVYLGQTPDRGVVVLDPPYGPKKIEADRFHHLWTGNLMVLLGKGSDAQAFKERILLARNGLSQEPLAWSAGFLMLLLSALAFRPWQGRLRALGLTGLFLLVAFSEGCEPRGTPRLELKKQVFDFGFLPRGEEALTIPIRNSGSAPLAVRRINRACECTLASAPSRLAAGEFGQLVVKPKHSPGPTTLRLLLETNDPAGPHEIQIRYFGESPPSLDPPRISVQNVGAGARVERLVRIVYSGGDSHYALRVKNVSASNSAFKLTHLKSETRATSTDVARTGNRAVVGEEVFLVECEAPVEAGAMSGTCTFTVEQANHELQLQLPVFVNVRGLLQAQPDSLFFASVAADASTTTKRVMLRVEALETKPRVVSHPMWLACSVLDTTGERSENSHYYQLEVTMKQDRDRPSHPKNADQIVVEVPGVERARLHIPVHLMRTSFEKAESPE